MTTNVMIAKLYQELLDKTSYAPLSQTLPLALRLARELGETDFEEWVRLENDGYADVPVPAYRCAGRVLVDQGGHVIPEGYNAPKMIDRCILPFGMAQLEQAASSAEPLILQICDEELELLRQVSATRTVYRSAISPIEVTGVLSDIKSELSKWLDKMELAHPDLRSVPMAKDDSDITTPNMASTSGHPTPALTPAPASTVVNVFGASANLQDARFNFGNMTDSSMSDVSAPKNDKPITMAHKPKGWAIASFVILTIVGLLTTIAGPILPEPLKSYAWVAWPLLVVSVLIYVILLLAGKVQ